MTEGEKRNFRNTSLGVQDQTYNTNLKKPVLLFQFILFLDSALVYYTLLIISLTLPLALYRKVFWPPVQSVPDYTCYHNIILTVLLSSPSWPETVQVLDLKVLYPGTTSITGILGCLVTLYNNQNLKENNVHRIHRSVELGTG